MSNGPQFPIRGDRLAFRLAEVGMSQAELARRVGVKQPSIAALISGKTQQTRHLHRIARELATTPEWLTAESDDRGPVPPNIGEQRRTFTRPPIHSPTPEDLGLVELKEVDLTLGLGGAYISDSAVAETKRYVPRDWLREMTRTDPVFLRAIRTRGNSMKPTLSDGDWAIIDLSENAIREQDGVYAIAVADLGMVKRIWANPDGSYKIKSDNPNVDPETAVDGEMFVIGLVVGKLGKL